jgi:general secretion pathway protein J
MRRRSWRSRPSVPWPRADRAGREGGFTLIELLVAMTLLGLVAAVLAGGLRLGVRVWETERVRSEAGADVEAVQGFLRRLVQQATPYHDAKETEVAFEGRADGMTFVAPLPSYVGFGGLNRVRLEVEKGRRGEQQLVFRHVLLHPDVDPRDAPEQVRGETVLLAGLEAIRISYYGGDGPRSPRSWVTEWLGRDRLPDLVRVEISLADSGRRLWPSLVVSPMLGLEVACLREPNESRCRRYLFGE